MKQATLKKVTVITSFYESPYHKDRAPYNEQMVLFLKNYFDLKIIRPIAWTDILKAKRKKLKPLSIGKYWNDIPISFPIYYFLPKTGLRYNGLFFFLSLIVAFIRQRRIPDAFYTTWAFPDAYATMLLAKIFKRPYVLFVLGTDINDLAYRESIQKKVKKVLNDAYKIISPSDNLKQKMIALGIEKNNIEVIYTGIEKEIFHPVDKLIAEKNLGLQNKKRILYIGNFKQAKGAVDILKAFYLLLKKNQSIELCMIGMGEAEAQMRSYIKDNKLNEYVNIVGFVEHKKLAPWINASDCVCLPSYGEGVPNVLLEAMACETNFVSTSVGGIPEIVVQPEQVLIEPGDIEALALKLQTILENGQFVTKPAIKLAPYSEIAEKIGGYIEDAINVKN